MLPTQLNAPSPHRDWQPPSQAEAQARRRRLGAGLSGPSVQLEYSEPRVLALFGVLGVSL
jgi:hypothetical protein